MAIPNQWEAYDCAEYFDNHWAECGHFDERSQTLVIVPVGEAYESVELEFFAVGRSGVDFIDFGYRQGHAGLWAYHPISGRWQYMAASVAELVDGWCSGQLSV